jgi:hypothetical protein
VPPSRRGQVLQVLDGLADGQPIARLRQVFLLQRTQHHLISGFNGFRSARCAYPSLVRFADYHAVSRKRGRSSDERGYASRIVGGPEKVLAAVVHCGRLLKTHYKGTSHFSLRHLANQLVELTAHRSNMGALRRHPLFDEIVALGEPAVPLILRELERKPGVSWFGLLATTTGENPAPPELTGRVEEMAASWLAWGRPQCYLECAPSQSRSSRRWEATATSSSAPRRWPITASRGRRFVSKPSTTPYSPTKARAWLVTSSAR